MGLILDSSVLIEAERAGVNAERSVRRIRERLDEQNVAISTITLMEMAHGLARADTSERRYVRERFLSDLAIALPVHPVTIPIALRAGQMDGENKMRGVRIALSDLLIGVTALELGYEMVTHNLRHFRLIPGLTVVAL